MRGSTIAAVATCTLLAITGCAKTDDNAPIATAGGATSVAGLDKGTAAACTLAEQATKGEDGRDLDLATAKDIVAVGATSKSTIITAATDVLSASLAKAQAAAGEPDEAVLVAEVSSAILKVRTACQDTDAVKASITKAGKDSSAEATSDSTSATDGKVN
ncbi:hypothetical protein GCM10010168_26900 [Actinoplanes ianthinogenes]|uniref:Secreted protein n=1 Tax=Actinoplanes ianthinogenes TaxID=122358 RepID=A0ABM7LKP1_9ACTN|nr:hypothetical protein [Actinoplanes ianthinogenes]BCJ39830.1 hypothetical protein Aiant_04870 [Actinoplanes ianthinogenes]GGR08435.1 hypothetical protein GCM10010168_26900 [Actinoplanes ianthinogenes]